MLSTFAVCSRLSGRQPVEREVEQQDVDARLAQKTEESPLDMLADELRERSSAKLRALATRGT